MTVQIKTTHGLTMHLYKVHNIYDLDKMYYIKSRPDDDINISIEGDHVATCNSFSIKKTEIYSIDILHS